MILITTHLQADFDGLASMVAARKLYPDAAAVFPGGTQETVHRFLSDHDLGIMRQKDLDVGAVRTLVLVDVQDPDRIGPFKKVWDDPGVAVHIYDHHPTGSEAGDGGVRTATRREAVRVIEPVGATTTVLVERLRARSVALRPDEATVLAIGLYEETGSLAYPSTTPRDLEAVAWLLRSGADLTVVAETLRGHLAPEAIAVLNDLFQHSETFFLEGRKVLVVTASESSYKGDLAALVHQLVELQGVDAVIAAIGLDNKIEVIGRSKRPEVDVGQAASLFGGGGHAQAASACVHGRTLVEVKEQLVRWLTERHRPTLLARDVMTRPVKTVDHQATILAAETAMTQYEVNVLPVLDGKSRYLGVVSREAIQKALYHKLGQDPVATIMQTDVFRARPESPFREVEQAMLERNQRFVPILEGPRVVGVITRTDLLRTLHDEVLSVARVRAAGAEPAKLAASPHRKHVGDVMRERLPARVVKLLEQAGEVAGRLQMDVCAVGGFVRDLLLGRPNLDVDLMVEGDGLAFARALGQALRADIKQHPRFGTAVVILPDGFKLDVATARTEYYEYPTALPTVERSSIKRDLYRRDFTINTLAIRLTAGRFGELLDFYGGQRDLHDKIVRVLHSLSFVDDPTRVFRAVRFEQRYGFHLSQDTLGLIKSAVERKLFHRLSGTRLCDELSLLLSEPEPRKALARLGGLGLLGAVHPSLKWTGRLEALLKRLDEAAAWYRLLYLDRPVDTWVLYLMGLVEGMGAASLKEALKRLALPAKQAAVVVGVLELPGLVRRLGRRPAPTPAEIHRLLNSRPVEVLLVLMAAAKTDSVKRAVSAYLTAYQRVKPALSGADLRAMGFKPGPQFKTMLDRLLEARLNGEVASEADERAFVARQWPTGRRTDVSEGRA
jgi:tRNA nucleotidyltransferase (CCA-adding enzyme)